MRSAYYCSARVCAVWFRPLTRAMTGVFQSATSNPRNRDMVAANSNRRTATKPPPSSDVGKHLLVPRACSSACGIASRGRLCTHVRFFTVLRSRAMYSHTPCGSSLLRYSAEVGQSYATGPPQQSAPDPRDQCRAQPPPDRPRDSALAPAL